LMMPHTTSAEPYNHHSFLRVCREFDRHCQTVVGKDEHSTTQYQLANVRNAALTTPLVDCMLKHPG